MKKNLPISGTEYSFPDTIAIISHTDHKGKISFVNQDFIYASGFSQDELLGRSHNIIRHPDVPQEVFRDLWATLKNNRPWTGVIKNRCKNGDHYWARASVTTRPDGSGYSSIRVKPSGAEITEASTQTAQRVSSEAIQIGKMAEQLNQMASQFQI